MPKEVFGSWVIWYLDLCGRENFLPIWHEVRLNYIPALQSIMDNGVKITQDISEPKEQRKEFFEFVGRLIKDDELAPKLISSDSQNIPVYKTSKEKEQTNTSNVQVEWCHDPASIKPLALFFAENVDINYISHGEVQDGRAIAFNTWRPDLEEKMLDEFQMAIQQPEVYRLAVARENGEIVGIAFFAIHTRDVAFIEIQDFLVKKGKRNHGIGTFMIKWLENEMKTIKATWLFFESGIHNEYAHRFFARHGYQPCSKVMMKRWSF